MGAAAAGLRITSSNVTNVRTSARRMAPSEGAAALLPSCRSSSAASVVLQCRAAALPLWPSATAYRLMPVEKVLLTMDTSCSHGMSFSMLTKAHGGVGARRW